jgi:DNA-binding transcriptional LysR family regulator
VPAADGDGDGDLAACRAAGFRPTIAHYSDEWDTGAALVAYGLGIFLLPRLAPLHRGPEVVRIRLRGPSAPVRAASWR